MTSTATSTPSIGTSTETLGYNEPEPERISSEEEEIVGVEEEIVLSSHLYPVTVGIIKNLGQRDEYISID